MADDPTPGLVFQSFIGYQLTAALRAAIDVDLFTAIGAGVSTVPELARRCGASERGVRILADFLVTRGFLSKSDGRYGLTPVAAAFLDTASPACLASAINFLAAPAVMEPFDHLTEAVRSGRTA